VEVDYTYTRGASAAGPPPDNIQINIIDNAPGNPVTSVILQSSYVTANSALLATIINPGVQFNVTSGVQTTTRMYLATPIIHSIVIDVQINQLNVNSLFTLSAVRLYGTRS